MRLLVLGGTWFLGRALVEEALRRGHEISTFNRGISGPDVLGSGLSGAVNVAAPAGHSTFGEFLGACVRATGSDAELEWVDDDFLLARGVRMWTELPLWRAYPGTWQVDASQALAAGLRSRPLAETVADTWAWMKSGGAALDHARQPQLGIDPGAEQKILADWDERPGAPPR